VNEPKMIWKIEQSQKAENLHLLYIYDDVSATGKFNWNTWEYDDSETSAKFFREELAKISEGGEIELHINSNGGSVKEGTAIYNQLVQHESRKTGYVDGVAHSVAFLILQACDKRVMGLGTSALIHNMWMQCEGNATQLRKYADDLDAMMESNRKVFLKRATITEQRLMELMEVETYLTPQQCLDYGLIDEISGEADQNAINQLNLTRINQLQREVTNQKQLREEIAQLIKNVHQSKPLPEPTPEPTPEPKQNSLLNLFKGMSRKEG